MEKLKPLCTATKENSLVIPQKIKMELPYDPATPRLGIYPQELKAESWRGICTPILTAAILTTAQKGEQRKGPSMDDEQLDNMR